MNELKTIQLGVTGVRLRQLNTELLRKTLRHAPGGATKLALSRKTGLSLATCGTLLAELLEHGEAVVLARSESSGGRPPLLYGCNRDNAISALLYPEFEDGTQILTGAAANAAGELVCCETMHQGVIGPDTVVEALTRLLERFPRIRGAAVSVGGEFPELSGGELPQLLKERIPVPVALDNPMNFVVAGYFELPDTPESGTVCWIHFPQNGFPRAGIAVDGVPLRGNSGFAGELSFLPFGISREQQMLRLRNRSGVIGQITETIASLAAVLNPEQVVLSGSAVDAAMREPLRKLCGELVPPEHLPKLVFRHDIREACFRGMAVVAQFLPSPQIRLVKHSLPIV